MDNEKDHKERFKNLKMQNFENSSLLSFINYC
jgi:hypothetical protein